ncbi:hypothetical protein F4782DRAFT_534233 [Xylaria castorea]|nr:hypothetical protein F4782DRAFT_534233 [Xylaria castorea]
MALWTRLSTQINGSITTIRLTAPEFDSLSHDGEALFLSHSMLLTNKATEFIADTSNPNVVFLGQPQEMEHTMGSVITRFPGSRLRMLWRGLENQVDQPNLVIPANTAIGVTDGVVPSMSRKRKASLNAQQRANPDDEHADDQDIAPKPKKQKSENPKPMNSFFLFRQDYTRRNNPKHQRVVSGEVSMIWKSMSAEEKAPWQEQASNLAKERKEKLLNSNPTQTCHEQPAPQSSLEHPYLSHDASMHKAQLPQISYDVYTHMYGHQDVSKPPNQHNEVGLLQNEQVIQGPDELYLPNSPIYHDQPNEVSEPQYGGANEGQNSQDYMGAANDLQHEIDAYITSIMNDDQSGHQEPTI